MRNKTFLLLIVIGLFLLPVGAFADALGTATFNLFSSGGTDTLDAGTGMLSGSNIPVRQVTGTGTQLNNNGIFAITDGFLSYTTTGKIGTAWSGWTGGSFTVTGCIISAGLTIENNGACDASNPLNNPVLISGNFQQVSIIPIFSTAANVSGSINGSIDQDLAAAYGLSTSFSGGVLTNNLSSTTGLTKDSAFTGAKSTGGSISVQAAIVSVPEDWSVSFAFVFFGFALATFGLASRFGVLRCKGLLG